MSRIPLMQESKDPDEVRAYSIDWSDHLGGATISSSSWTVASGNVSISTSSNTTTVASVLLAAGGEIGSYAELKNQIVTSGGETLEQSIRIRIAKR